MTHAIPSREVLQQAHPGVAAAADLLLGQASRNKSSPPTDSKVSPQPQDNSVSQDSGSQVEGQGNAGQIPWRQVAGLLHAQGVTDPQGLVSAQASTSAAFTTPAFSVRVLPVPQCKRCKPCAKVQPKLVEIHALGVV